MAQRSSSASRSTAKKNASATRRAAGTKKRTSSSKGSSRSRSTSKRSASGSRTGSRNSAQNRPTRTPAPRRPIRREVGCVVLLLLGLVSLFSYFPVDGWLIGAVRTLLQGLFGWGYYIAPVCILWGSAILGFHRGRPVILRLSCVLLLPMVFGAFIHILLYGREEVFSAGTKYGLHQLWTLAQDPVEHCGGVIGGIVGIALKKSIGLVGGFLATVIAVGLMMLAGMNLSPAAIAEQFKNRPVRRYEPIGPDEMQAKGSFSPDDYFFPLDGGEPIPKQKLTPPPEEAAQRDRAVRDRSDAEQSIKERVVSEELVRKTRPSFYDQSREAAKDELFAEFRVDNAEAAQTEKDKPRKASEVSSKPAPRPEKKSAGPKPKREQTALADQGKSAEPERDIQPLSIKDAAEIAGVEMPAADVHNDAAALKAPKKEKIDKDSEAAAITQAIEAGAADDKPAYVFPPVNMLNSSGDETYEGDGDIDETEAQLESAVRSFGVGAGIVGAVHGPTITRYELKLDQGVKLNKITNLAGDIALSLGVKSVRIAPVPDRMSTVGVEVPNKHVRTVWLGDLVDSDAFRSSTNKLSVALGKDIGGNVVVCNLAKMPHLLIAGTTGSGKSVCVNSMILSLLYKSTPDEVRMIMIDPKMVEFVVYNGMPHLYVPVVTDAKKAAGALQWAVVEMLKRYRLFSEAAVRDLASYNAIRIDEGGETLPQVVIFIDELADLMLVASKDVEEAICRVAQMGRAAGMHLVIATQSPRADVITGLMKANIPSRIALSVSGPLESRIILDQQGAEKLLGNGDMLYSPIGSKPIRLQGAFVTDEEREDIINFVKQGAEAEYSDEILAEIEKAAAAKDDKNASQEEETSDKGDYDELLPQAVDVIFETKQASVSMLQRRLKLGYSRAARLIDQLEEVGVVGPYEGSKPRKIILTKQQWQEMQYSQGTAPVDTIAREFAQVSESGAFDSRTDDLPAADIGAAPSEEGGGESIP